MSVSKVALDKLKAFRKKRTNAINMYNYYVKTTAGRAKMAAAYATSAGKAKVDQMILEQQRINKINLVNYYFKTPAGRAKVTAGIKSKGVTRASMYEFYFNTAAGKALIEAAWKTKAGRVKVIAMRKA